MPGKLYEYLCEMIGSEETVQMRRRFFNVINSAMTNKIATVIYSGSKAEGLDMTGSDIDIMTVENVFHVLYVTDINESLHLRNDLIYLLADTENANPGFAVLKPFFTTFTHFEFVFQISDYTADNGYVISNHKFKELHLQCNNTSSLQLHGPSLSPVLNSLFDLVYCLGGSWPYNIKEWTTRPRYCGWPSEDLIYDIVQQGVCFVPIGSKFGSTEDNPHEWRISFSIAEKMLIHSFNHVQLLCYALFKIILKDILQTRDDSCQLLCSYYLKTVMFWVIEEKESCLWIPQNFVSCFRTCFNRLLYFVTYGYCPNYFIPANNMFEGKVNGNIQKRLLKCLTDLQMNDASAFRQSETLMEFLLKSQGKTIQVNWKPTSTEHIIDSAIYPLLYTINNYLNADAGIISDYIATCLRRIRQTRCRLEKQLFLFLLCRLFRHLFLFTPYDFADNNRKLYRQLKRLRSYLLVGSCNEGSGWILVALMFYKHGQFDHTRFVIDHVLSESTPEKMLVTQYVSLKPFQRPCSYKGISFLKRHKLSCIHQMTLELNENTCLYPLDLGEMYCSVYIRRRLLSENVCTTEQRFSHIAEIQRIMTKHRNNDKILAPPLILAQFIKFMTYHHQGNTKKKHDILCDMKTTVENHDFIEGEELISFSGNYLKQALLLSDFRPINVLSVDGQEVILFIQDKTPYI